MTTIKIDPTLPGIDVDLSASGAGGHLVFFQLVGAFSDGPGSPDTSRNSGIVYAGQNYGVDNGFVLGIATDDTSLVIRNYDPALSDNSDPNGDYGLVEIPSTAGNVLSIPNQFYTLGSTAGGRFTIDGASTVDAQFLFMSNANTLIVTGPGSRLEVLQSLDVDFAGGASLLVEQGGTVAALSGSDSVAVIIGDQAGSSGLLQVTGSGSELATANYMAVGQNGDGTISVGNGGLVSVRRPGGFNVGTNPGGRGTIDIAAGGTLRVDPMGSTNALQISISADAEAAVTVDGATAILDLGGASISIGNNGNGNLSILDGATAEGSAAVTAGQPVIFMAYQPTGTATLSIVEAGSRYTTDGDVVAGSFGTAHVTIADGATLDIGGYLGLAMSPGGTADLQVLGTGAALRVGRLLIVGSGGTGDLVASDGGSIEVQGSLAVSAGSRLQGVGSVGGTTDNAGTITAADGSLGLGGAIGGTGVLSVGGDGELALGAAVAATQTVEFDDATGTLDIADIAGFAASVQNFQAGDTIDLVGQPGLTIARGAGGQGQVEIYAGQALIGQLILEGPGSNAQLETAPDGNGGTDIAVGPVLFTAGNNVVDFNALTADQVAAIVGMQAANDLSGLYDGLGGRDTITLPDTASAGDLGGTGVAFDLNGTIFADRDGDDTYDFSTGLGLDGYTEHETLHIVDGGPSLPPAGGPAGAAVQLAAVSSHPASMVLLPGSPGDYTFTVSFGNGDDWNSTQTVISYYAGGYDPGDTPSVTITTTDIEIAKIADPVSNPVNLDDDNLYAEMAFLANAVYGREAGSFHPNDPLAYSPGGGGILTVGPGDAAAQHKWHPVSAMELGLPPADYGNPAYSGVAFSFVNGLYQAIAPADDVPFGAPEADALILTGVVGDAKTLAVVFRGTDQLADFNDYPNFTKDHYAIFQPLVAALLSYARSGGFDQILVDGHSLGAAMAQIFAASLQANQVAANVRLFTFGSPGAENPATVTNAVNFAHTNDFVVGVGKLSQTAAPAATAFTTALGAGLVSAGLLNGTTGLVQLGVYFLSHPIGAKYHTGTDVAMTTSLAKVTFHAEFPSHNMSGYRNDILKLVAFADDDQSPFHSDPMAMALSSGDPLPSPAPQIAVESETASPESGPEFTDDGDTYVLGNPGIATSIVWRGGVDVAKPRTIDGGEHDGPIDKVDFSRSSFAIAEVPTFIAYQAVQSHYDLFYANATGQFDFTKPFAHLYRIDEYVNEHFQTVRLVATGATQSVALASATAPIDFSSAVVHLDGSPTTVQQAVANQTIVTDDGTSDIVHAGTGVIDIESTRPGAIVAYGPDTAIVHALGVGSIVYSDGDPGTTPVTIDSGPSSVTAYGGSQPQTFVGHLAGAEFFGGTGNSTLDYSALGRAITVDLAAGGAGDSAGRTDSFTNIGTIVAPTGSGNTLLLANTGSTQVLGGLGTALANFATLSEEPGGDWHITGQNAVAGIEIMLEPLSTLNVPGTLVGAAGFFLGGGTLVVESAVDPATSFDFSNASGDALTLNVAGSVMANPIAGFGGLDAIRLPGIGFAPGSTPAYDAAAHTLSVPLAAGGSFTLSDFDFAAASPPPLTVTGDAILDVACFAEGTVILTDAGPVAVERLGLGNRIIRATGGRAEAIWIGHRRIDCRRHPRKQDVLPVRVHAGAFGDNLPVRDLLLSPDHAVFLDGALIPIRYLVNGRTVVQEKVAAITYWHVELAAHDIILAEGLPCESYLDTGNRSAFVRGAGTLQLHPNFTRRRGPQSAEGFVAFDMAMVPAKPRARGKVLFPWRRA